MFSVVNLEIVKINGIMKQEVRDYFFHLQDEKKEKINLIWESFVKYKIMFPHSNPVLINKKEILEEICCANYIENRMMSVAELSGELVVLENRFR